MLFLRQDSPNLFGILAYENIEAPYRNRTRAARLEGERLVLGANEADT